MNYEYPEAPLDPTGTTHSAVKAPCQNCGRPGYSGPDGTYHLGSGVAECRPKRWRVTDGVATWEVTDAWKEGYLSHGPSTFEFTEIVS